MINDDKFNTHPPFFVSFKSRGRENTRGALYLSITNTRGITGTDIFVSVIATKRTATKKRERERETNRDFIPSLPGHH